MLFSVQSVLQHGHKGHTDHTQGLKVTTRFILSISTVYSLKITACDWQENKDKQLQYVSAKTHDMACCIMHLIHACQT